MFERYREIQQRRNDGEASESGFTLIELLIVIIVLGILAAIVIFSLTGITGQSKQAACTADAKSVEIAAAAYQAKVGTIATQLTAELVPAYLHGPPGSANGYSIGLSSAGKVTIENTTTNAVTPFVDTGCTAAQIG